MGGKLTEEMLGSNNFRPMSSMSRESESTDVPILEEEAKTLEVGFLEAEDDNDDREVYPAEKRPSFVGEAFDDGSLMNPPILGGNATHESPFLTPHEPLLLENILQVSFVNSFVIVFVVVHSSTILTISLRSSSTEPRQACISSSTQAIRPTAALMSDPAICTFARGPHIRRGANRSVRCSSGREHPNPARRFCDGRARGGGGGRGGCMRAMSVFLAC